jgi:pilus assembly protein CpaE
MRILLIDDEPLYQKMISRALEKEQYELKYAQTGQEGLATIPSYKPETIILDLQLPDMNGFDILQRIRRDPNFSHIPVIFVTAQNLLEDKLKAFDLGADDYLVKPFQPEELVARLGILARRGKAIQIVQQKQDMVSTIVAVHSLRGGIGCSTLTTNLATAFYSIWGKPTLIVDAVLAAGQVAMMLDGSPRATWEDCVDIPPGGIDDGLLDTLVSQHKSGLNYIAAPKYPIAVDSFKMEFWKEVFDKLRERYEFVLIDVPHDFSDEAITLLNTANNILLLISPDMASLRAADSAINIYDRLGYPADKVKLVLNYSNNHVGIKQAQLEKVLGRTFDYVLPYEPNEVFKAINFGEPFMLKTPELAIGVQIENMAYKLSDDVYKNIPPAAPSPAWKRVTNRFAGK